MRKRKTQKDRDLTALSGSATDVARLGRGPKPGHERTAGEDGTPADWDKLAKSPAFRSLLARKKRFIVPACIFFILYFFSLPVLVGFAPAFMATPVWGKMNLAYLFALSQFFMAWGLSALYVREASHHDREAAAILSGRGAPDPGIKSGSGTPKSPASAGGLGRGGKK